jgi:hypothetical protein
MRVFREKDGAYLFVLSIVFNIKGLVQPTMYDKVDCNDLDKFGHTAAKKLQPRLSF